MNIIETAFCWHSGKDSALYSFASTRQLWSEEHRTEALKEVEGCIIWQEGSPEEEKGDLKKLRHLRDVIIRRLIGKKLPCPFSLDNREKLC